MSRLRPVRLNMFHHVPAGLTSRARSFVSVHAVQVDVLDVEQYRSVWLESGIPAAEVDRVAEFQSRWGGIVLPPAPVYDGGPRYFEADTPDSSPARTADGSTVTGWWFEAGTQRCAVPYGFVIGPAGEFGIATGGNWAPLHASVEGWVESLALAHHAAMWAKQVTRVTGAAVNDLDLDGFEPVAEVRGLADTWWRGPDSLVAVYSGESACLDAPLARDALIYSGLDDWGLRGGV
jgi:hypothetical protein